ncbi:MAG: DNA translocase FtsK [Anaerolineales bacterium]|nr:MAG: DNA translocase FtsK [Anaerolineales bacterium]
MAANLQLQPYLNLQADRLEAVLNAHRAPGRITGGTVGPRHIRFYLNPAPNIRYTTIKRLAEDLALALRVPHLTVDRGTEGIVLAFNNPNPQKVTLQSLIDEVVPVPASTAVLGLADNGVPLLARLASPDVAHILVAGTTGSGKSVLLQCIAASLIQTHSPSVIRLLCIDPKGHTFSALANAPHMTRRPIANVEEAHEAMQSLCRMMELRDQRGEYPGERPGIPRIVVLIDELADLIMQGSKSTVDMLTRLAQRGREAGIHLVAATQHPSSAILSSVMRANFPLRLVGKVTSAQDARIASGRAGTNAHSLGGRGDFIAVSGGDEPSRFQVPNITQEDLQRTIRQAEQTRTPVLSTIKPKHLIEN